MFEGKHYKIWKVIGIELGIGLDSLNAIQKVHTSEQECLQAMIDGANPIPTRETMAKVLQSVNINEALAGIIMRLPQTIAQCDFEVLGSSLFYVYYGL